MFEEKTKTDIAAIFSKKETLIKLEPTKNLSKNLTKNY